MTLKDNKKQQKLIKKTNIEESLNGMEFDFQRWLEKKGKKNTEYKYIGFSEISHYK